MSVPLHGALLLNTNARPTPANSTARALDDARDRERPTTRPPRRRAGERPRELAQLDARVALPREGPRPDLSQGMSLKAVEEIEASAQKRKSTRSRAESLSQQAQRASQEAFAAIERKDRETVCRGVQGG